MLTNSARYITSLRRGPRLTWLVPCTCALATILLCSANTRQAARYDAIDIGPLPRVGDDVEPRINASGEISCWRAMPDRTIHAFILKGGLAQDIGTLAGSDTSISARANAQGQSVGWSISGKNFLDSGATTHAFLYSHSRMLDLGTLGGRDSKAMYINESGETVGQSSLPDESVHAFLYRGAKLEDLGTLPGGTYSVAYAINKSGLIAGAAETSNHLIHAVTWTQQRLLDLGTASRRAPQPCPGAER